MIIVKHQDSKDIFHINGKYDIAVGDKINIHYGIDKDSPKEISGIVISITHEFTLTEEAGNYTKIITIY